jgi:UDP-N-acetylmuramoylalanine--D-glutamate ligase
VRKEYVFQGKRIVVVGLGISGFAVAKLLHNLGAIVTVNDAKPLVPTDEKIEELTALGITCIGGGHEMIDLTRVDLVIKNPGIPYYEPFIENILARGIPILTEPEVAMQVAKAKIIALTGTNGKTTTTMMIYKMLLEAGEEVYFAGNIGVPLSDVVLQASKDAYIVLELSSFQLMGMPTFRPDVAIMLNLDEAHLDYHSSREEYEQAKMNIFKNMGTTGLLVLNHDDTMLVDAVFSRRPEMAIEYFSLETKVNGSYLSNDFLWYAYETVCHVSEVHVPGAHNLQNILAAITAVKYFNVSDEHIVAALQTFTGMDHRLEFVDNICERRIYNDSKATNIKATQIALSAFQEPIIWIAGGLDRGADITSLRPFGEHVKAVVTFGESRDKFIALAAKMHVSSAKAHNLAEALAIAYDFSEAGDIILLSPASASWDQFASFEERGNVFKSCVKRLAKEQKNE